MGDKRMLSRAVSQSRKVNSLSLKAALLWTWAIPWFDSYGYLEVEPDFVKFNILPRRQDIQIQDLVGLLQELSRTGLWKFYKINDGNGGEKLVAFDPKFKDFQTLREDRLGKQRYNADLLQEYSWTTPGVDGTTPPEVKIREDKGREGVEGKPKFGKESLPYRLSKYLASKIQENSPKRKEKTEGNLQRWAYHIDLLIRIDNKTPDDIGKVIEWSQKDSFWKTNILSTKKLRDKFDDLISKGALK